MTVSQTLVDYREEVMDETALLPGATVRRFFVSYSGVRMPFKLITELTDSEVDNRNTFFRADFNDADQLLGFDKVVYGEVEMSHRYRYDAAGVLTQAEITNHAEEDTKLVNMGQPVDS